MSSSVSSRLDGRRATRTPRHSATVDMRATIALDRARCVALARASSHRASRVVFARPPTNERRGCVLRMSPSSTSTSSGETDDETVVSERAPWVEPGYRGAVVSAMDERVQGAIVVAVFVALLAGTYASCATLGPALERLSPSLMAWSKSTWPIIGITYVAAGVAHFSFHDGFVSMTPHRGAWGFWNLPGSASFHVNWTGVAEILGGAGLLLGSLPFGLTPDGLEWLTPVSAACLFALTLAVTPANVYMFTHNSPGPLPPAADESAQVIPPAGHAARFLLQVFLLSLLHGCIDR